MNQLSLFGAPSPAAIQITRTPPPAVPDRSDVIRVVQHKSGPLLDLRTKRRFRLIELEDGSVSWEFVDSCERAPAPRAMTRLFLQDSIDHSEFVEVWHV